LNKLPETKRVGYRKLRFEDAFSMLETIGRLGKIQMKVQFSQIMEDNYSPETPRELRGCGAISPKEAPGLLPQPFHTYDFLAVINPTTRKMRVSFHFPKNARLHYLVDAETNTIRKVVTKHLPEPYRALREEVFRPDATQIADTLKRFFDFFTGKEPSRL
jgi:hypothetical protein